MNKFSRIIAALSLVVIALFLANDLFAQRRSSFGGSRSSSSRPSYSSPPRSSSGSSFGGYRSSSPSSAPSRPSYTAPSRSYSSSGSPSGSGSSYSSGPGSSFGSRRSASPSSSSGGGLFSSGSSNRSSATKSYGIPRRESYGGQTYSYKSGGANTVGINRSSSLIPRRTTYSYNDVYNRRNTYYSGMGFAPPPYIGYTSPSYGMFSTLFMLSALQNLQAQQNAMFFYHHWHTPSMMAWRNDMHTAAQSDPQAAQRIRELEARVQQLEHEHNGVRDTTYMPEGVDSSVVLSNEALGVSDGSDSAEAQEQESKSHSNRTTSSSGSGLFWIVLIGGGLGVWWLVRRRRKASESANNRGSFS